MNEDYVTTQEAARIAKVTRGRIRQLLLRGRLKGRHFGRDWQVELTSLKEFTTSTRKPGRPPIDKK
jgi:excisionase family DNA binding protein